MTENRIAGARKLAGVKRCLPSLTLWMLASVPGVAASTTDIKSGGIELELSPRVCTLSAHDEHCDTVVRARWSAPQEESLCLVIVSDVQEERGNAVGTRSHRDRGVEALGQIV